MQMHHIAVITASVQSALTLLLVVCNGKHACLSFHWTNVKNMQRM